MQRCLRRERPAERTDGGRRTRGCPRGGAGPGCSPAAPHGLGPGQAGTVAKPLREARCRPAVFPHRGTVPRGPRRGQVERNRKKQSESRLPSAPPRGGRGGGASHTHIGARGAFTNTQGVGDPRDVRSRPFLSHIQKTGFYVGTRGGTRIITAPWFQLGVGDPRCLISERWESVFGP